MAQKLTVPIVVETPMGPVEATHKIHNYAYSETGERCISSSMFYGRKIGGKFMPLTDASSCLIQGADLDAIAALTPANIAAKHEEIVVRNDSTIEAKRVELEKQLADFNEAHPSP